MDAVASPPRRGPDFRELYTPKLITVLREGYGLSGFRADAVAGLTVAIVALPLSMAIAIASHVTPERGLFTAIVGSLIVSLLGGTRFQVGGPAGAFIVLVASTVDRHGLDGLFLATMMAGVMLAVAGFLRLGTYVKFIPYPVTVGFTAGIALIIFSSQIHDLLGLTLTGKEPAELLPKLVALAGAAGTVNPAAVLVTALTIGIIIALKKLTPTWPAFLIAVAAASLAVAALSLPVETIGTRFGGIPRSLPAPSLPPVSIDRMLVMLPDAISFALLGAIESLLSAVVADGMAGTRHDSNQELIGQGIANLVTPLFGGIAATGAIARTATNIRNGGNSPLAGVTHAATLVLILLFLAPLASNIPLCALAAILFVVVMGSVLSIAIATEDGVNGIDPQLIRVAHTLGVRGPRFSFGVLIPAALPGIVTGLKLGWSFAWRALLAGELLFVSGGLGQLLTLGRVDSDGDPITVDARGRFVGLKAGEKNIAFDRSTGKGVSGYAGSYAVTGAQTVKFPFGTKKTTYDYLDQTSGRAWPVSYSGTTSVKGLEVYVFKGTVPEVSLGQYGVLEGTDTLYSNKGRTVYVEPVTGSIVSSETAPTTKIKFADGSVKTALDIANLVPTDETIADRVAAAKSDKRSVQMLQRAPYALGVLGALLLAGGAFLSRRRRDAQPEQPSTRPDVSGSLPAPRSEIALDQEHKVNG